MLKNKMDDVIKDFVEQDIKESLTNYSGSDFKHYLILDYPEWDSQKLHLTIYYNVESDILFGGYQEVYMSHAHIDNEEDVIELAKEFGRKFNLPVYQWERRMVEIK